RVAFADAAALVASSEFDAPSPDGLAIALHEEAVRTTPGDDVRRRAFLQGQLARSLYFVDRDRRHALSVEALDVARGLDDPALRLSTLLAREIALLEPGTMEERLRLVEEAQAIAAAVGDPALLAELHCWRVHAELERGDGAAMRAALQRYH